MRPAANIPEPERRTWPGIAAIVVVAWALCAFGLHAYALTLDSRARDATRPLQQRAAAARQAERLESWSDRARTTAVIVEAERLYRAKRIDDAYALLLPMTTTVRGDALFRDTYQKVLAAKWPLDARKAHQQHAKEAEDGALDPEDVFR